MPFSISMRIFLILKPFESVEFVKNSSKILTACKLVLAQFGSSA